MPFDVLGRTRATLTGRTSLSAPGGLSSNGKNNGIKHQPWVERHWEILGNPVVLGIDLCNYWS